MSCEGCPPEPWRRRAGAPAGKPSPRSGRRRFASSLFPLPPRRRSRVFKDDAAGVEILPDPVCFGEVPAKPGGATRSDELLDLLDGHWRLLIFLAPEGEDAQDLVEALERLAHGRSIGGPQLAGVDGRVQRADEIEHHAESGGAVHVVPDMPRECLARVLQAAGNL